MTVDGEENRRSVEVVFDWPDLSTAFVEIGGGLLVPRVRTGRVTELDLGVGVDLTVVFDDVTRSVVIAELTVRRLPVAGPPIGYGPPITGELLRKLRPADYLVIGMREGNCFRDRGDGYMEPVTTARDDGEGEGDYVARIYRMAQACGYSPTKAVREALGVAESTAAQKVVLARKQGLLPPTEPGKARA